MTGTACRVYNLDRDQVGFAWGPLQRRGGTIFSGKRGRCWRFGRASSKVGPPGGPGATSSVATFSKRIPEPTLGSSPHHSQLDAHSGGVGGRRGRPCLLLDSGINHKSRSCLGFSACCSVTAWGKVGGIFKPEPNRCAIDLELSVKNAVTLPQPAHTALAPIEDFVPGVCFAPRCFWGLGDHAATLRFFALPFEKAGHGQEPISSQKIRLI